MVITKTRPPSLLDAFSSLEQPLKQKLASIKSPLTLGLATLVIAEDMKIRDYMSAEHIVAALEAAGVAVKKTKILRAFARAGGRVSRKIIDEEIHYKVMTQGRNEASPMLDTGALQIFYIDAGKPRTARKMLQEVFSKMRGEIRICDPYYGIRTLDVLEMIDKNCKVNFLTAQTNEKINKLSGPFGDFKREWPKVEMRRYTNQKELHDRYVLCSDYLLILGHGIKDIGNKESFVIRIDSSYASDLINNIKNSFDNKWKISQSV
jgi:hypothetical protein